MSSVTRFLRQIPTGLQYYAVPSNLTGVVYVPADTSSPTVVNDPAVTSYPSAVAQSSAVVTAIGDLSDAILRDMGKTIKAVDTTPNNGNVVRYFRAFQVLVPQAATTPISPNDGVVGSPTVPLTSGYAPYFTIYMPVTIAGMGSFTAGLTPLAGGQM
jgi:hypothetical protein